MLKIWTNYNFGSELEKFREKLGDNELFVFPANENGASGEAEDFLRKADVVFGAPSADAVLNHENVKWLQVSSAGYTAYDRDDFKQKFEESGRIMTNSSAVYVEPCAQHILALMMSLARRLPESLDNQRGAKSWESKEIRRNSYLLNDQTALILGLGTIGKRLAELLTPLKMNLIAFKRKIRGDELIKTVTEDDLDEYLAQADHVINILPANDETKNFLNRERFSKMKKGARVYNIGRGTTLEQNALIEELKNGKISAAYLDVTDPEPLPPENPLWTTANCYITPHTAGGFSLETEFHIEHFAENLRRFENGEELNDRIY